jgi:hypothetical protein
MSLVNCKLKQDTTMHLLVWPKFKMVTTPNADEDVNNRNSHCLLVGMQNGMATFEEFGSFLQI